jgi:hypothetical protein
MRVLVLTNHFAAYCGSEIVALEVAQWFRAQGDNVTLGANYIAEPIQSWADGVALCEAPEELAFSEYDLIWCQHDMLGQLPPAAFERAAAQGRAPHVAMISLSPFEPYEQVDARLTRALSAEVIVNSVETGREVLRQAGRQIAGSRVRPFYNAAPLAFSAPPSPPGPLKSVVLISNHAPPEATKALAMLADQGVSTRHIGVGHDYRLVQPADIAGADAVISIGKSVAYAIAQRKPVYMYDHFGGDGWLTPENFVHSQTHNFSGRPSRNKRTADAIVREIQDGYADAAAGMRRLGEIVNLQLLSLDHHLSALRRRAAASVKAWRAMRLRVHLLRRDFRAHLEQSRTQHQAKKLGFLEQVHRFA